MVRSKRTAHPNPRFARIRNSFKFQRHGLFDSEAHSCKCNDWAILNLLKGCNLELPLVPNFGELLFGEENADGSADFCAESDGAGGFEPKLIDSQSLDFCVERLRRDCQFGRRARWP
jgi:hypothetical protein